MTNTGLSASIVYADLRCGINGYWFDEWRTTGGSGCDLECNRTVDGYLAIGWNSYITAAGVDLIIEGSPLISGVGSEIEHGSGADLIGQVDRGCLCRPRSKRETIGITSAPVSGGDDYGIGCVVYVRQREARVLIGTIGIG